MDEVYSKWDKMKKIIIFTVLLFITFFIKAEGKNVIEIEPSFLVGRIGENISVNISILPSEEIIGAQCDLFFNSSVLQVIEISKGNLFELWIDDFVENFTEIDNENGSIKNIIAFSFNSTNESGTLAQILFRICNESFSSLNISSAVISDVNGNSTEVEVINGSIYVDIHSPVITLEDYPPSVIDYRDVHFEWNATDDTTEYQNILFSYKLDGYDSSWSPWGYIKQKDYYNLNAGSYTFKIKAKDEAGNIGYLNYSFNVVDNTPPVITNVAVNPAQQIENGYINITCDITDDFGISLAKAIILYPDASIHEFNMHHSGYYLNQTYSIIGTYYFYIYTKDIYDNEANSSTFQFEIIDKTPPFIEDTNITPSVAYLYGQINISCIVTDNVEVEDVFLNISYPDGSYSNFSIKQNHTGDTYYCSKAYNIMGTYEFFIYAVDTSGNSNVSDVYQFEILNHPPIKPYSPFPENGESNVNIEINLTWECYDADGDSLTYDIYFGTNSTPSKIATVSTTSYNPGILQYSTKYYWRIVAWDKNGAKNESQIWYFETIEMPNHLPYAYSPFPNNMENVSLNPEISVYVHDEDGDKMNVYFYNAYDDSLIGIAKNISSGEKAYVIWNN
ncbi:MAG TPA: hypothetical protein ENI33_06835, partial [Thermoplasmatales archaeon]|nr:hypothetical protein [Thermoplasmatales archaeon]